MLQHVTSINAWTDGGGLRNAASLAKGAPQCVNCGKRDAAVFPRQLANERIMHEPLRRRRPGDVGTKKMHANFFDAAVPEKLGERLATFSHTKKKSREVAWAPRTAALSFALEDTARLCT